MKFNSLVDSLESDNNIFLKFKIKKDPLEKVINSLIVIENEDNCFQGTGFLLNKIDFVTCAHVLSDSINDNDITKINVTNTIAFKFNSLNEKYKIKMKFIDYHRDIAIFNIIDENNNLIKIENKFDCVNYPDNKPEFYNGFPVKLIGFPSYANFNAPSIVDANICSKHSKHGVQYLVIDMHIIKGNSGGPVINFDGQLVGVAVEGLWRNSDGGQNKVLHYEEIKNIYRENEK